MEFKFFTNSSATYKMQKHTKNNQKLFVQRKQESIKGRASKRKNQIDYEESIFKKEYLKQVEQKYVLDQKRLNELITKK